MFLNRYKENMKNLIILAVLSLFALSAKASETYVYGSLQATRQYVEIGRANDDLEIKYEHDFESQPYGVGAEYRFADDGDFFFGAGVHYQSGVKIEQNTTLLSASEDPSGFTTRNDLQHMSFTHIYANAYSRVNKGTSFFLGTQYTIPEWRSHGTFDKYRMRNNLGFRLGLDLKLPKSFGAQLYYRNVFLETEDRNGYSGEINISSLMANIGYRF